MTVRVAVVGDVLLDRDVVGSATRVCPDAPVPVVDVDHELVRPGGAGLAATLLARDGMDVTLVATVGHDDAGRAVARLLAEHGVRLLRLPTAGRTREKVRVRAADQSLVRLDRGTPCKPSGALPPEVCEALREADAVLVSDYAGGMTSDESVRAALSSVVMTTPVVWDPHPRGAGPIPGCQVVTPNATEAALLVEPSDCHPSDLSAVRSNGDALLRRWSCRSVCVTLGASGALLTYGSGAPLVVPAERIDGGDTCGAGDRFAATVVAALATGQVVSSAVQQAVVSATVFVAAGGASALGPDADEPSAAQVPAVDRLEQVLATGGTVVATGGCFDLLHAGHVALLRAARSLGDYLVVCLNSDRSVRRLKGQGRPLVPEADRARVLEALECVDAVVVFDEDTPEEVLDEIRPAVWVKGGDYALADLPESAVVSRWGGQTVVLPYLDGRSTTALIGAASGRTASTKETR